MDHLVTRFVLLIAGAWDAVGASIAAATWTFAPGGEALLGIGAALALVLVIVVYRRTTEGLTPRARLMLGALRCAALVLLLAMVSGAAVSLDLVKRLKPRLVLVVDDSASMALPHADRASSSRGDTAAAALADGLRARLDDAFAVDEHGTGAGATQDLAVGLIGAATGAATRPPAAILVISDGAALGAAALERAARELPAPVSALAVGADAVRDVVLERVQVPSFVWAEDRALATAELRSHDVAGDATVRLFAVTADGAEKEVASTSVALVAGEAALARIEFRTAKPGLWRYAMRVDARPDELSADNNAAAFDLDVRGEKIRVLFIEGQPSWEYKFVKRALEADPAIDFHGLVRIPEQDWFYQGRPRRPDGKAVLVEAAKGFPATLDELAYFDVLIIGDLERKQFEQADRYAMVEAFVTGLGGGLMTIGGFHVYGDGQYQDTPVARLLPVAFGDERAKQLVNRFNVRVAGQGLLHPAMQLEYDPAANQRAWNELPWVEGGNALSGVKPGATLLLTHDSLRVRNAPRPIAAAWQRGNGRVLASALDGTWHWGMARTTETDYHQRFWGLTARWLAGDPRVKKPQGDLIAEDPSLEVGKPARFHMTVRSPEGDPRLDAAVEFTVMPPSGGPVIARAKADPRVPGRYGFAFTPAVAGEHAIAAVVTTVGDAAEPAAPAAPAAATRSWRVAPARAELLRPAAESEALARLAAAGGGASAPLSAWRDLPLPAGDPTLVREARVVAVWQSPVLLALLILCLVGEWLMRKRRGLS